MSFYPFRIMGDSSVLATKLNGSRVKNIRKYFCTQGTVNLWYSLPGDVTIKCITGFKQELGKFMDDRSING